jgi:hypothetical protein
LLGTASIAPAMCASVPGLFALVSQCPTTAIALSIASDAHPQIGERLSGGLTNLDTARVVAAAIVRHDVQSHLAFPLSNRSGHIPRADKHGRERVSLATGPG